MKAIGDKDYAARRTMSRTELHPSIAKP